MTTTELTQAEQAVVDEGEALLEAIENFSSAVSRAGGRDSDNAAVRHFSAYHLADLQGSDAGWLGGNLLIDEIRLLINGGLTGDEMAAGIEPREPGDGHHPDYDTRP